MDLNDTEGPGSPGPSPGESLYRELIELLERLEEGLDQALFGSDLPTSSWATRISRLKEKVLLASLTGKAGGPVSEATDPGAGETAVLEESVNVPVPPLPRVTREQLVAWVRRFKDVPPSLWDVEPRKVLRALELALLQLSRSGFAVEAPAPADPGCAGTTGDKDCAKTPAGPDPCTDVVPILPGSGSLPVRSRTEWWPRPRELRKWVTLFKNRLAVHLYLNHMFEPGWPELDETQAQNLLDQARNLEAELMKSDGERLTPPAHISRMLKVPDLASRIVFYLMLGEVGDWELPTRGSSILAAMDAEGASPEEALGPFAPGAPLMEKGIVRVVRAGRTVFSTAYRLSQDALRKLMGDFTGPRFFDRVPGGDREQLGELREPRVELKDVILPDTTRNQLLDALVLADPRARSLTGSPDLGALFYKARGTVFLFEGPPGTGKTMAAEGIARHLGKSLYIARYDRIIDMWMGELEKNVTRVFGEAEEADSVLLLDEADALLAARGSTYHSADKARNTSVNLILGLLEEYSGVVILTTNLAAKLDAAVERRLTARVRFGLPGVKERELLWKCHLTDHIEVEGELDVKWLSQRFVLSGARIRSAVLAAFRKGLRRQIGLEGEIAPGSPGPDEERSFSPEAPPGGSIAPRLEAGDVVEAARDQARSSFRDRSSAGADDHSEVGEMRSPGLDLDHVILPDTLRKKLRECLVSLRPEARSLFESPGFLSKFKVGRGVALLFEGPSGTGKTMAAEAIAGELSVPLYILRLERLLSMWVGESEKGISRAFDEAQAHDAVLLIDEADSLLSSRTSGGHSGDRMANNLVNLLLNRLEESSGIVILTTNHQSALDKALDRRLAGRFTFPIPEAEARLKIIQYHLPEEITLAPDADLAQLARRHVLSGGAIRNAILGALRLLAGEDPAGRTLSMRHLEQAFKEARTKDSRPLGFKIDPSNPQAV